MAGESHSYDDVPYIGRLHTQSHINHLAVVGTLFGLNPSPLTACRVLEVGCADGTNLIAMAQNLPQSQFVGIDGSSKQIEVGQRMCTAVGLANVTLIAADIHDIDPGLGDFDYIVVHGVFSWIAVETQHALLQQCRRHLSPNGVLYISYNTYPGWHAYNQLRDMMRFHAQGMSSKQEEIEQARAMLQFLQDAHVDADSPRAQFFATVVPHVLSMPPDYLFHEYLEANNRPMYFHEFIAMATNHDLQYLGESSFNAMMISNYPPDVQETLNRISHNIIELEQYMDFLRNRRFRSTLLCHSDTALNRSIAPSSVVNFHIAFSHQPTEDIPDEHGTTPHEFVQEDGSKSAIIAHSALHKVALLHLAEQWPNAVRFADVARHCAAQLHQPADETLCTDLAELFLTLFMQGVCHFRLHQPPVIGQVPARPMVSRLVRYQARHARVVASQRHEMVQLTDGFSRELVSRLDGQHTADELVEQLMTQIDPNSLPTDADPRTVVAARVHEELQRMARQGVLVPMEPSDIRAQPGASNTPS